MPTPIFDAILESKVIRPSDRLQSKLERAKELRAHAEYFESIINPAVVDAIRLLERDDASLKNAQIEATFSIREDISAPWRSFGTTTTVKLARILLEDFIVMRLHFDRWIDERKDGLDPSPSEFSHGAVPGGPL